jgi:periplasmic protein TonB
MPQSPSESLGPAPHGVAAPALRDEIAEAWHAAKASPFWITVIASTAIHMGALVMLAPGDDVSNRGRRGAERDAVGVEIITLAALESLSAKPAAAATETPGADAATTQDQTAIAGATAMPALDRLPDAAITPPMPGAGETPAATEPAPVKPAEPDVPSQPAASADISQAASVAALAAASAGTMTQDGSAAATASAGDMSQFEIDVRDALGRHRPSFTGATGHVEVVFGLTEAGDLRTVSIARSSGNDKLDKIVLRAIRSTLFPLPPAGMTDLQRSFSVPFDFQRVQIGRSKTRRG